MKVLKELASHSFSGLLLDNCLQQQFLTEQTEDVYEQRKMRGKITQLKEILSVNMEQKLITNDYEQSGMTISRVEFEEKCAEEFAKLRTVLEDFLKLIKNLELGQPVDDIELLGGTTRVPRVKQIIEEVFGRQTSTHFDGDMSMSLGATIASVNLSEGLKVKKILFYDGPAQEYTLNIKIGREKKEGLLFKSKTPYGSIKNVSIRDVEQNFEIEILCASENYSVKYEVKGVTSKIEMLQKIRMKTKDTKVIIKFEMDYFGLPQIKQVTYHWTEVQGNPKEEQTPAKEYPHK